MTSRQTGIPAFYVLAEVAAAPIASEASLAIGATRLDPRMSRPTRTLWRATERDLIHATPAHSIDDMVRVRDRLWFDANRSSRPLASYVSTLSQRFLVPDGAKARPALSGVDERLAGVLSVPSEVAARRAWRWISFAMPPELLLAALPVTPPPSSVQSVSPLVLRSLADRGFAETHLHLGAALEFGHLWIAATCGIADPDWGPDACRAPGAAMREGKDLSAWLLRAALARYLLAAYLSQPDRQQDRGMAHYLTQIVNPALVREFDAVHGLRVRDALLELQRGSLDTDSSQHAELRYAYSSITGVRPRERSDSLEEWLSRDPIGHFFPVTSADEASSDIRFLHTAMGYLHRNEHDTAFGRLFWQLVRVQSIFYRNIVLRPMTPGLQWFVRAFGRLAPSKRYIGIGARVEAAASVCGLADGSRFRGAGARNPNSESNALTTMSEAPARADNQGLQTTEGLRPPGGLRSLEVRTSPKDSVSSTLSTVREAISAAKRTGVTEFGLVFHFLKRRGGGAETGTPRASGADSEADPSSINNATGYRFAAYYNQLRSHAKSLAWVLWHFPLSMRVIRGIDIAGDELAVPIWVFAPVFRYLETTSDLVARRFAPKLGDISSPLHKTVHAGEDYVHLLGGLRRLEEAIDYLGLREGDRIGHGLALGLDAESWGERAGGVIVTREERLWDLVWEWKMYAATSVVPQADRASFVEREIARLSMAVFAEELRPSFLARHYRDLHSDDTLRSLGFPDGAAEGRGADSWLLGYLTSRDIYSRGQETEWVDTRPEGKIIRELQRGLRRKVASRGLTVEVNPSSNLLIDNLGDLQDHPLWRLCSLDGSGEHRIAVCIGSDDPVTFATRLPQEYTLLYDAMLDSGASAEVAGRWLEQVRARGLAARFTLGGWDQNDAFECPRVSATTTELPHLL